MGVDLSYDCLFRLISVVDRLDNFPPPYSAIFHVFGGESSLKEDPRHSKLGNYHQVNEILSASHSTVICITTMFSKLGNVKSFPSEQ